MIINLPENYYTFNALTNLIEGRFKGGYQNNNVLTIENGKKDNFSFIELISLAP